VDDNENFLFGVPYYLRVGQAQYIMDGMMLPFGHSREDFSIPNP
jgi:hypothetical protein